MGEFGYGFTQSLRTDSREQIKYREFHFTPSLTQGEPHEMKETVEDYEQTPPKRYTRTQKIDKHYYDLNAKPMIVLGPWKEEVIVNTPN
ncbi:hypothetical protein [Lewinella sp. LCG006]|uniref:hypothetical protein n=1 Tax=Lewinella sp. LCG006 TaxID=3231911 RepID=UPI00345F7B21